MPSRVFPPGAKVYVDGELLAKVLQAFPQGSTSHLFPHYTLQIGNLHRKILDTSEITVVAMNRVGTVKKKARWGAGSLTEEEKRWRWAAEYDAKHPLGTMEEARMVAEREQKRPSALAMKTARSKLEREIWRKTPKDYRTTLDGERAVLVNERGGTALKKLSSFTDDELVHHLARKYGV